MPISGSSPAPDQDISGINTNIDAPFDVSIGPAGNIWVVNKATDDHLYKFAPGATGNVSPTKNIATGNVNGGIVIDTSGNIWVGGWSPVAPPPEILEYASSGTLTNTIVGSNTGLGRPVSLALDASGNLYVANGAGSGSFVGDVEEFPPTATGNASPTKTIVGSHTNLSNPTQIWIDESSYGGGRVVVSDQAGHVLVFSPTASGNATPLQDITSVAHPSGVATDSNGDIYVSVPADDAVRVFAAGATGNATPLTVIKGSTTNIDAPGQLYIKS